MTQNQTDTERLVFVLLKHTIRTGDYGFSVYIKGRRKKRRKHKKYRRRHSSSSLSSGESGSDSEVEITRERKKRHKKEKERVEESIGKEGEPEEKAGDAEEGIISKETIEPCTTVDMSSDKTTAGQ